MIRLALQLFEGPMYQYERGYGASDRFEDAPMNKSLQKLISISAKVRMTPQQVESQRLSFAYGSAKIENDFITKEMVKKAAEKIKQESK